MPQEDPSTKINAFLAATNEVAKRLGKHPDDVRRTLPDALDMEDQIAVMGAKLSVEHMESALKGYSPPELLGEIELEDSIIPDGVPINLREATAKHRGEVWRVHRSDADPFPSNPHAHCLEHDLKLHLGTGELFRRRTLVGKLPSKDLVTLRKKLGDKLHNVTFPALA
jgi:hypothetical protein